MSEIDYSRMDMIDDVFYILFKENSFNIIDFKNEFSDSYIDDKGNINVGGEFLIKIEKI